MEKDSIFNFNGEVPLGLGMALAQNMSAMEHFAGLSETEKKRVLDRAHAVHSKQEMRAFVDELGRSTL